MTNITEKSHIRVIWRDKIENYSKEKVKEIKNHIKNKYKTNHVRVSFQATNKLNIGLTNLDTGDVENINRPETQEKIILQYLKDNNVDITVDDIKRLNKKVEAGLEGFSEAKDNKYRVKNLTVENFLAFGDKVSLNFEDLKGITLINGDNFAGKTSLIVDALRFLLFNTTSKTKTADEVINRFRNQDSAKVSGELVIDNVEYLIEREVIRKWKKDKSSYTTSTNLNFYKKDENGEYQLENGEQRAATDKIIRENIGNEKEFLMTVMCTGKTLFDIIEAKPTERGQLLSKFLGLEIFEHKEGIAKEMYKNWKVSSKLGKYSSVELQVIVDNNVENVRVAEERLVTLRTELEEIVTGKTKAVSEKDDLLKFYHRDIDPNMVNLNEEYFTTKIERVEKDILNKKSELESTKGQLLMDVEKYDAEKYASLQQEKNKVRNDRVAVESRIKGIESEKVKIQNDIRDIEGDNKTINRELERLRKLITDLKTGKHCPTCGQELAKVDHTDEIEKYKAEGIKEKGIMEANQVKIQTLLTEVAGKDDEILNVQESLKDFDDRIAELEAEMLGLEKIREKNSANDIVSLKIDKIEVEIETLELKKSKEVESLNRFNSDLGKIEANKLLDEKIRKKEIEITDFTNQEYHKNREIQTLENNINNFNNIIQENTILIATLKKEEHIAKVFDTYIAMVGKNGISKTILKNTVPVLNIELAKLMEDTAEFTVSIEINEKNNEVDFWMIDNRTDIKAPLSSGSGYETTVGALGLRFVLSKVNTLPKPSMLLIDEIFGTVTNNNLELIKLFIDKIAQSMDNIFMITHNELVKEWANNIITVVKNDNVSTVK